VKDLQHWRANPLPTDTAYFDIAHYIRQSPAVEDYDLRRKFEEWRETGIVVFEQAVPAASIDLLLQDIEYLCARRQDFELEVEHKGARYRLQDVPVPPLSDTGIKFNCLENVSLAARQLSLNRFVCDFLSHVFLDRPVVIQSLTFWRGSEQPAHLDYPWVNVQTRLPHLAASWVALEDVHEDAGPLEYYPGSHKEGVLAPFDWGAGSVIQTSESTRTAEEFTAHLAAQAAALGLRPQRFLPRRGDVLVWHGALLHGGTKVRDAARTRKSYVTHYTPLAAYPKEFRLPGAPATGHCTALNGGYVFDHPWLQPERRLPSWGQDPYCGGATVGQP
jgi:phytanoyl-CoA hydroxylase